MPDPTTIDPAPGKWIPSPKVATGTALGTPVAMIVTWVLGLVGHAPTPEVTIAIGALITGLISYLVPNPPAVVVSDAGQLPVKTESTGATVTHVESTPTSPEPAAP